MAKVLARVDVRDVDFNDIRFCGGDRIPQSDRGVRIGAGIEDDRRIRRARFFPA